MSNFFRSMQDKSKLKYAFKVANLTLTRDVRKTKYTLYPIIHSVKYKNDFAEMVFTLPNGVDPSQVEKHEFVFKQVFGTNTEVRGDLKRFVLRAYTKRMTNKLTYQYKSIQNIIKSLSVPIICGIDRTNQIVAYDMQEHPHLLIAGETGSGKSTQIRSVLTTLIKSQSPNELRLVLGDMKRSEFHLFRNVAHVDAVCTTTDELTAQLSRISSELEKRGDLLDRLELTHTSQISRSERPPNMIVCIDEVALLKKEKDIMEVIENISSIGRALGVFLILSMQRPDAKVLDGKLKNNLTVRMAFRHADTINSRITMGSGEAAGITTKGRMWLKIDKPREIQGPYLEETEAKELLADYKVRPKEEKKEVEKIFGTLEGDFD